MMRHRMYHVIGYIRTHGLLVFIITLGVASSVIGASIILSANTNTVHDALDESQAVAQNGRSSLEQCLTMINMTESIEQYKQQLACYESYAPNSPEKNNLQNKINEMEVGESVDSGENESEAQNKNVYMGGTVNSSSEQAINQAAQTTGISTNEVTVESALEQEKTAQCEVYKQRYGDKTPEELAREDPEVVNMLHDLAMAVAGTNCCPEPDWMIPEEEMLKLQDQCTKATAYFKEVEEATKTLMKNKINYYTQLSSVCDLK